MRHRRDDHGLGDQAVPPQQAGQGVARKEEPAKIDTGSIDKPASPTNPVTSREDPRWQWCEQRHIDHQAGRAPGGATDLSKKLEDDRVCAAVYERG